MNMTGWWDDASIMFMLHEYVCTHVFKEEPIKFHSFQIIDLTTQSRHTDHDNKFVKNKEQKVPVKKKQ